MSERIYIVESQRVSAAGHIAVFLLITLRSSESVSGHFVVFRGAMKQGKFVRFFVLTFSLPLAC